MFDYRKGYSELFNAITDAIELIEKGAPELAVSKLKGAQISVEEKFMEEGDGQDECGGDDDDRFGGMSVVK